MSTATLARPPAPGADLVEAVRLTARRLAEAEAEFDAALDAHEPMHVLVKLDQEVADAARCHRAAEVVAARRV